MGEVYRARDTKLHRDVAIKVLPVLFAANRERLARFKREAQVLASLNHPNIAAIYGFEDSNDTPALVLELIEGPTLADRIAQGSIPVDDALPIARQISDALEAAHDQGIIHRDLKPANIKVRPDGTVKILDFGLARVLEPAGNDAAGSELANSPTITSPAMMTGVGALLGTAAYMAPEQTKGHRADKRSDIWAFGCVLYEMLTGTRAFAGDDVAETIAAVLKSTPDWSALPSAMPPAVRVLIETSLLKDRSERIGDIAVARFLLNIPALPTALPLDGAHRRWWRRAAAIAATVALAGLITTWWWWRPLPGPAPVVRLELSLPQGQQLTALNRRGIAISPDGRTIAYIANRQLFVRSMSDGIARPLAGAVNVATPTFSPDGASIAFWSADRAVKRIVLSSGAISTICESPSNPLGMSWGDDGVLFTGPGGIFRVSPSGGRPELLIPTPSSTQGRVVLSQPQSLTHESVLFTMSVTGPETIPKSQVVVQSLKTSRRTVLIDGGADALYLPAGYVIYATSGTLFAAAFDDKRLALTGGPVPVVEGVLRFAGSVGGTLAMEAATQFAVSRTGVLLFIAGPNGTVQETLAIVDRTQAMEPLKVDAATYNFPRLSPDGRRLAVERRDGNDESIYIYDLSGGSAIRRLTFGGSNRYPVWSPDSARVAFQSDREGDKGIFEQSADGGGVRRLTRAEPGASLVPQAWSPDGSVLLYDVVKAGVWSLAVLTMRDGRIAPFGTVRDQDVPSDAVFSPDGHWVSYQTGSYQRHFTFVEPFPPDGTKFQIGEGGRPLWSRGGHELYYIPAPAQFVAVEVKTTPTFAFSTAVPVPRGFGLADPMLPRPFDVTNDGRFVVILPSTGQTAGGQLSPIQIQVVLNWLEEVKQRVQGR